MAKDSSKKTTAKQPDPDITKTVIEELQNQVMQAQQAKLQVMADFENYRKRVDGEKAKYGLMHNMQLVSQLLEIIDDIQLALGDENLEAGRAKDMLQITHDKVLAALTIAGLEKVAIQVGDKFDSAIMEAVTSTPVAQDQDNTVITVVSSAFRYAGQSELLKPAKVIVGKASV